jgi:ribosome-associated protein
MEFNLDGHLHIELCNLLKATGLCHSGGMAKMVIGDGAVCVDGIIETRKRCKIKSGQIVEFDQQRIKVIE